MEIRKGISPKKNDVKKVEQKKVEVKPTPAPVNTNNDSKNSQKELKTLQNKLEKIEQKISGLEAQKVELENELSKPQIYGNATLFAETNSKYEKVSKELEQEQNNWETLAIETETLEKKLA